MRAARSALCAARRRLNRASPLGSWSAALSWAWASRLVDRPLVPLPQRQVLRLGCRHKKTKGRKSMKNAVAAAALIGVALAAATAAQAQRGGGGGDAAAAAGVSARGHLIQE